MIVNNNLTENQFPIGQSPRWTKGAFDIGFSAVIHPTKPQCFCNAEKQGVSIFMNVSIVCTKPFLKISLWGIPAIFIQLKIN
jgi:hypothetical protein